MRLDRPEAIWIDRASMPSAPGRHSVENRSHQVQKRKQVYRDTKVARS